jgi:dipeptide/tripeptide permease
MPLADKFDKQLIEDVKRVLSVGFVFIPLPVFWALYDQQVKIDLIEDYLFSQMNHHLISSF